MSARIILCLDLDAFYASVEELLHPEWRGQPIVVGGKPDERGVVASCNYAARKFGVRSAMPMSRALQLCPHAIRTPPRFGVYRDYSQRVMRIIHEYGCPVEQVSVDEVFLDGSEGVQAWGDARAIAADIKRRIHDEVGLTCTIGIASSKLVAKIASNQGKPDGLLDVRAGEEAQFLAPLAVKELWGVGPKSAAALHVLGIKTIGDVQRAPLKKLERVFGKWADDWQHKARGVDASAVVTNRETKSISRETTFVQDIADPNELKRVLLEQAEEVAHDLRDEGLHARTIAIKLRWANFETLTRQSTLAQPTNSASDVYRAAAEEACDADAASAVGDAALVAEALVKVAAVQRGSWQPGGGAPAFGERDLETRVRRLLASGGPRSRPARALLLAACGSLGIYLPMLAQAASIHHTVETILHGLF